MAVHRLATYLVCAFAFAGFQSQKPPHLLGLFPGKSIAESQWTEVKWTTDGDKPFRVERDNLEGIFADGRPHPDLVSKLESASQQMPRNQFKLFQWCYATYLMARNDISSRPSALLSKSLSAAKPPYSYEFLRMRFLVVCKVYYAADDYVVALGERLAKADPKDIAVLHELSRNMLVSIPEARKKAFAYANRLRVIDPSRPEAYSDVAAVYYNVWMLSDAKDTESGHKVIYWLNEYLKREKRPVKADNVAANKYIMNFVNDRIVKEEKALPKKP